jgi:hypothetical protein
MKAWRKKQQPISITDKDGKVHTIKGRAAKTFMQMLPIQKPLMSKLTSALLNSIGKAKENF